MMMTACDVSQYCFTDPDNIQHKRFTFCNFLSFSTNQSNYVKVSAIAKPWEVQHKIAKLVADEFFDQGDLEKLQLNTKPIAMMDRERKDELPKMQVGFIDVICLPLYKVLSETFPWISPLYEETMENRKHWQDLAEKGKN